MAQRVLPVIVIPMLLGGLFGLLTAEAASPAVFDWWEVHQERARFEREAPIPLLGAREQVAYWWKSSARTADELLAAAEPPHKPTVCESVANYFGASDSTAAAQAFEECLKHPRKMQRLVKRLRRVRLTEVQMEAIDTRMVATGW